MKIILLHTARFIVALVFMAATSLNAAPPAWWSSGSSPVITGGPQNNLGVANVGQAKNMARKALTALQAVDAATASAVENDLVGTGKPIASWSAPVTQAEKDAQRAPLLIGQLKAISAPFYTHLHGFAPAWLETELATNLTKDTADPNNYFPWTTVTYDDNNKTPATIGQLKSVFSLRFENLRSEEDADDDGLPDEWEVANGFNPYSSLDANSDSDSDGLTNIKEYQNGTNPNSKDTDGDSLPDKWEILYGLSPLVGTGIDGPDGDPDLDNILNKHDARPANISVGSISINILSPANGSNQ